MYPSVRKKLIHLSRRIPRPILILALLLVVLCPVAILHFSTNIDGSTFPLNDEASNHKLRKDHQGNRDRPERGNEVQQDKQENFQSNVAVAPPVPSSKDYECPVVPRNPVKATFDLANLTNTLTDLKWNGDDGVWDQEMEASYQKSQSQLNQGATSTTSEKLLVYVVPFSHADPGWLSTVEEYFIMSTKSTLDNMLKRLTEWPDMTFIWAETSYFKMWWETLDEEKRKATKKLIASGRLEIVNGGYVMPDEATCHQYAVLHQYVYGHQWLLDNLGVVPEHGFSIDPFGHSSSMPYILKQLDLKTIFIQRIHYNLRKHLAQNHAVEFMWQQPWDTANAHSIFTHLAPSHLYTIKNICALSKGICEFFDFKDIMFEVDQPQMQQNAALLLQEMRKTASIFPHKVLLYILGDDFRWADDNEWPNQYNNFRRIMKYLNGNAANNVEMKFGTLKSYYDAVSKRTGSLQVPKPSKFPTVEGDFFPYADKFEDYWTGYFTSRPFYKQMSRELERDLRTAEVLLTLSKLNKLGLASDFAEDLIGLERAAASVGLFQHHDAITGTSKRMVALDYGNKLQNGLMMAHAVILKNIFRLARHATKSQAKEANIILENYRPSAQSLPVKSPLFFTEGDKERIVYIFNPLARSRTHLVQLLSETPNLMISDANGRKYAYQVGPALNDANTAGAFLEFLLVSFYVELEPLALKSISIRSLGPRTEKIKAPHRFSTYIASNNANDVGTQRGFVVKSLPEEKKITFKNSYMKVTFRADNGKLETAENLVEGSTHKLELDLKRYETTASGAYLFRPSGVGEFLPYPSTVRVLEGFLFSEVQVIANSIVLIVRLYNTTTDLGKSLEITLISDLTNMFNAELFLRLSTNVANNRTFYTDSLGFQLMERTTSHVLPMAANYYPATTMGFLQDSKARLTIHLAQAHGIGSQQNGELEVMLDRFLMQDDGRGVQEALQDPQIARAQLRIQLEIDGYCTHGCTLKNPSDLALRTNQDFNNPPYVTFEQVRSSFSLFDYKPLETELPCDVHLVMMKPVTYNVKDPRIGIMFHRQVTDRATRRPKDNCQEKNNNFTLAEIFGDVFAKTHNITGLNFIKTKRKESSIDSVRIDPMTITALVTTPSVLPNMLDDTGKH